MSFEGDRSRAYGKGRERKEILAAASADSGGKKQSGDDPNVAYSCHPDEIGISEA